MIAEADGGNLPIFFNIYHCAIHVLVNVRLVCFDSLPVNWGGGVIPRIPDSDYFSIFPGAYISFRTMNEHKVSSI